MGERVEWVRSTKRFCELEPAWNELAAAHRRPFCDHAWFAHWWTSFGDGGNLAICVVWRDDELRAVFPLRERERRLEALANDHTPVFEPLARSPHDLGVLSNAIVRQADFELTVLNLPAESAAHLALRQASAESRRWLLTRPFGTSPIVCTTGDVNEYLRRPGLLRNLPRLRRKMHRDHRAHMEIISEPAELDPILDYGFELEAAGWKGRAGTAIRSDPNTEHFYRSLARSLLARGELRVSTIWLDGVLVAFDLCVLNRQRLWLLKTAFDERYRSLAPGLVMRLSTIERCFELRLDAHELAGSTAPWKVRFANEMRPQVRVVSYPRRPGTALRVGWEGHLRPALGRTRRAASALRAARVRQLG